VSLRGGHLGAQVSALLDGQMSAEESARAWDHLADCRDCQQAVERESWVKRRVAGLSYDSFTMAPDRLKCSLLSPITGGPVEMGGSEAPAERHRRSLGLAAIGGGAVGAAMMGFIAFGPAAPAQAPEPQVQQKLVSFSTPASLSAATYRRP
jgi:hypothetical protein